MTGLRFALYSFLNCSAACVRFAVEEWDERGYCADLRTHRAQDPVLETTTQVSWI